MRAKVPLLQQCRCDTNSSDFFSSTVAVIKKNEQMEDKVLNLALVIIPTGYFQGGCFHRFQASFRLFCRILGQNFALSLTRRF